MPHFTAKIGVVMDIRQYNCLREGVLEAALIQARDDVANVRFRKDSLEVHIEQLKATQ